MVTTKTPIEQETKNPMEELAAKRKAAEQAQKEYEQLLNDTKSATVNTIKTAIEEFSISIADFGYDLFFANKKEKAVSVVKEIIRAYKITGTDLGLVAAPVAEGEEGNTGTIAGGKVKNKRGPQAAPFKKDGKEIAWAAAASTPPADVQEILDLWKSGKPINEFIVSDDKEKRLALIVRIEKNAEKKATKAQLEDLGYTRADIDSKAEKIAKAVAAAAKSKAKAA